MAIIDKVYKRYRSAYYSYIAPLLHEEFPNLNHEKILDFHEKFYDWAMNLIKYSVFVYLFTFVLIIKEGFTEGKVIILLLIVIMMQNAENVRQKKDKFK